MLKYFLLNLFGSDEEGGLLIFCYNISQKNLTLFDEINKIV